MLSIVSRLGCAALAGGLALLLGGCDIQFRISAEDLMEPPTLTEEQAEIQRALTLAVGNSEIKYKYPQNGDYRSSYIFQDLDGDGHQEALVFYQSESQGQGTWFNILDQESDGSWRSVCGMPAPGSNRGDSDVDFVDFACLTQDERPNIVVGWSDERQSKMVMVYTYRDGNLSSDFSWDYTQLALSDLDGDGRTDMTLLSIDTHYTQVFLASRQEEGFDVVASSQLDREVLRFTQISAGFAQPGVPALFIDSDVEQGGQVFQVTDVITARTQNGATDLVNLLDDETVLLSPLTLRPAEDIFCRDADGDGVWEVPTMQLLPGYEDYWDEDPIYLTTYNALEDRQLSPVLSGVINTSHRYLVAFPDRWLGGQVTVVSQPENGEWTFLRYQGDLSDTSVPLLRIRVYSAKDYRDKFETDYFTLLDRQGLFEYYAAIPNTTDPLAITQQELQGMFSFLSEGGR